MVQNTVGVHVCMYVCTHAPYITVYKLLCIYMRVHVKLHVSTTVATVAMHSILSPCGYMYVRDGEKQKCLTCTLYTAGLRMSVIFTAKSFPSEQDLSKSGISKTSAFFCKFTFCIYIYFHEVVD